MVRSVWLARAGVGLAALGMAWSSHAADDNAANHTLAVTIYNNDLALVRDQRMLQVGAGRQRLEFQDVSAEIQPETVALNLPDAAIVEQNFDFDLLTPAKLMEKAVGGDVTIVRTNPATGAEQRETARVLATNGGVVLKIGNRIEVLRDDGLPARVIFDKVPDNLRARPTLSVTVDAKAAGERAATLQYLTPGLGWRADYVAAYDEAAGKLDVQGWVTLTNTTGTTFENAETMLVAGSPGQDGGQTSFTPGRMRRTPANLVRAGTESGTRERLGDFYLYPLPERTTLANQQTKQVSFLDVRGVPAEHGYEFRNGWLQTSDDPRSARSVYRFSTGAQAGLGDQLPAGTLRFYMRDRRGDPQFIGESVIDHTPMGSTLSLSTGDAFDVKVKPTLETREQEGLFRWKTSMSYTLSNAMSRPVKVDLAQAGLFGDTRILKESLPSTRRDADTAVWTVEVPANGETKVTATFDTRF
jgi:hypothetical protein